MNLNQYVKYLLLLLCICVLCPLNAQKKSLSSGTFSKYDKVFRGNINDINLPDYIDGPHFFWIDSKEVKMWYVEHLHEGNSIGIKEKRVKVKTDSALIKGFKGDKNKYWLRKGDYPIQKAEYNGVEKVLLIGDVHGQYGIMTDLLKAAGAIDHELNWSWGNGHIVFIGDVFDRGDKVTESLYLIKKLQHQAKAKKGRVHFLLGNHEIMVLMNDTRYIAPKYKKMCKRLMINYSRFFKEDTELGKWLRSLSTTVQINDLLFVHAGISPKMIEKELSLMDINEGIRKSLRSDQGKSQAEVMREVYFPGNPLWYRGYLMKTRNYSIITDDELEKILSYYDVNRIFFGHTEVEAIRFLKNGKLVAVNVPMGFKNIKSQVLLIENDKYYRIFVDGLKEIIE
ncbi:metallophosphoesterase [Marinifilum sp.]|uniref:metallophosphoesterase n=1 Tax=Marinifilum sp. TaxID=2033137 RepID=UPI003BA9DA86